MTPMKWTYRIIHAVSQAGQEECIVITEDLTADAKDFVPTLYLVDTDQTFETAVPLSGINLDAVYFA